MGRRMNTQSTKRRYSFGNGSQGKKKCCDQPTAAPYTQRDQTTDLYPFERLNCDRNNRCCCCSFGHCWSWLPSGRYPPEVRPPLTVTLAQPSDKSASAAVAAAVASAAAGPAMVANCDKNNRICINRQNAASRGQVDQADRPRAQGNASPTKTRASTASQPPTHTATMLSPA